MYCKQIKKPLYCAFVDYSKAFDLVPRVLLWSKLLSNNINGKILDVIRNMYASAKSFVRNNDVNGELFTCGIGVRQGENLSPLLFALYINDLNEFIEKAFDGLHTISKYIEEFNDTDDTVLYLKLLILLYADDTIILAESSQELQAALNGLNHYCKIWKLKVNASKTKVVIFANRQPKIVPTFNLGELNIEVVTGYTYLGVFMKSNGNLSESIVKLKNQATRAMYSLLQRGRKLGLSIDIKLQLFDSLIVPICLYGCEVWGFKNIELIEKLHLQYCKSILHVNKSTPSCMVLGDLGRKRIEHMIDTRLLNYWFRVVCSDTTKLSSIFYKLQYSLSVRGVYQTQWIKAIKAKLLKYNLYEFWDRQYVFCSNDVNHFKKVAKSKIDEYYKNDWLKCMNESSKCYLYKGYKSELALEKYLINLPDELRICMSKFRMCNHKLPIELGRHNNIERNLRKCNKCGIDIGDEYHYLFICDYFKDERSMFIQGSFYKKPSVDKFCTLMSTASNKKITKLAKFAKIIMNKIK